MKFSRQDYQRGLPFPTPEDLPNPEIKPESLLLHLQADFFNHWTIWEAHIYTCIHICAYIHIFIIIFILSFSIYLSNIYLTRDVRNWKNMILVKKKIDFKIPSSPRCLLMWYLWEFDHGIFFVFQSCNFCLLIQFSRQVIRRWMRWSWAWISAIPGVWEGTVYFESSCVLWETSHILPLIKTCFMAVPPTQTKPGPVIVGMCGGGGEEIRTQGQDQQGKEVEHCLL